MCLTENCIADNYQYNYCKNCYFKKRKNCIDNHLCLLCDTKLRPFQTRSDWTNRFLHKKCWKQYRGYFC